MTYTRKNQGVCSRETKVSIENGVIENVEVVGGCDGNLKGICSILKGEKPEHVIERFSGISCGNKASSCPDQIAECLKEAINNY